MDRNPLLRVSHIEVMRWSDRYLLGGDAEFAATLGVKGGIMMLCLSCASWPVCSVDDKVTGMLNHGYKTFYRNRQNMIHLVIPHRSDMV